MTRLGIEEHIVDESTLERTAAHFRARGIRLPTFSELADPATISSTVTGRLPKIGRDEPHPLNLYRVHWYNDAERDGFREVPTHIELPSSFTGVRARIVVALGNRFPLIHAHKVLAAYACLVPRLVTGQFDPLGHRALWPSTGNYCRGGVAISKILGCRGVAILPEGMSRERFQWLEKWVENPTVDIVKTPGKESDVKEIYDTCEALERQDSANVVFNQFCEFGNHVAHRMVTGPALERIFHDLRAQKSNLRLAGFVSATGSAGTIGAGDYLKDRLGTRIAAVEALECPTLLYNGFGSHNIQGIGDKHVPFIHNVMNTDLVTAVSDAATDGLYVLFNDPIGQTYLSERHGIPSETIAALGSFGSSSICNVLAAIKMAKALDLGDDDVVITIATDGASMYTSEIPRIISERWGGHFDERTAAMTFGQHLQGATTDHLLELRHQDRTRIFNLGYFTWVEQRGVSLADFEARRHQSFWKGLEKLPARWDELIRALNERIGSRS